MCCRRKSASDRLASWIVCNALGVPTTVPRLDFANITLPFRGCSRHSTDRQLVQVNLETDKKLGSKYIRNNTATVELQMVNVVRCSV
jgi:hypothetical protein